MKPMQTITAITFCYIPSINIQTSIIIIANTILFGCTAKCDKTTKGPILYSG